MRSVERIAFLRRVFENTPRLSPIYKIDRLNAPTIADAQAARSEASKVLLEGACKVWWPAVTMGAIPSSFILACTNPASAISPCQTATKSNPFRHLEYDHRNPD